jgi:hypothetical protein
VPGETPCTYVTSRNPCRSRDRHGAAGSSREFVAAFLPQGGVWQRLKGGWSTRAPAIEFRAILLSKSLAFLSPRADRGFKESAAMLCSRYHCTTPQRRGLGDDERAAEAPPGRSAHRERPGWCLHHLSLAARRWPGARSRALMRGPGAAGREMGTLVMNQRRRSTSRHQKQIRTTPYIVRRCMRGNFLGCSASAAA